MRKVTFCNRIFDQFNNVAWGSIFEIIRKLSLSLGLFGIFIFFAINIQNTQTEGLEKANQITRLEKEIQELENERDNLRQEYDIFTSDIVLESKLRELEGIKKKDEIIYKISDDNFISQEAIPSPLEEPLDEEAGETVNILDSSENVEEDTKSNYLLWLDLLTNP